MGELQMKIDAVMRLVTASSEEEKTAAMEEVRRLLDGPAEPAADPETIIRQLLLDLGAPDNMMGHAIAVEAIMIVLEEPRFLKTRICELYAELGNCFDITPSFAERSLRYLIERTWLLGDVEKQQEYFGAIIDFKKGKPTNGQFIARLVNMTRLRMKTA